MFDFTINNVPVLFIQAFTKKDAEAILWFVREASQRSISNKVLFIDTPLAPYTVPAVQMLKDEGIRVIYRDHHGLETEPANENERRVLRDSAKLQQLLGPDCTITVRRLHPACSTLVSVGEFADAAAIIADPDADGLTGAMKAAGISYPELDDDAAILDGEPFLQVTGSPMSQYLAKSIAVLPSYDYRKPTAREEARKHLFSTWVSAVEGNKTALGLLQQSTEAYEEAVQVAREIAQRAQAVAPGVMLANVADCPIYDPGTLLNLMERQDDCRVTVLRKDLGPIAALHGIQYSLAVAKKYQDQIDLRKLIPEHVAIDIKNGVISNISFLLHVSEDVWNEHILPALRRLTT